MASRVVKRGVFEEVEDQENDLKLFSEIQSTLSKSNCGKKSGQSGRGRTGRLWRDHPIAAIS